MIMISFCSMKEQGDIVLQQEHGAYRPTLLR